MKIITIFLLSISMGACSNSSHEKIVQGPSLIQSKNNVVNQKTPTFKKSDGQAILIGNSIELLDNNLKLIEDISKLSGQIIEINGVSDSLFNQTKEYCNSFRYVKIISADKEGIVNGKQVFKILSTNQDTSLLINDKKFEILTTENFGMGVTDEDGLTGCTVDQPILIRDEKNDFFGLVNVIKNSVYKEAIWNQNFPYFQLRDDDGSFDKIISILPEGENVKIKIHRIFQEGENDYEVLLKYEQNGYIAEYLNYGEIKYE